MIANALFASMLSLANTNARVPVLNTARMTADAVEMVGDDTGYHLRFEPRDGEALATDDCCVQVSWLRRAFRLAGKKPVSFTSFVGNGGAGGVSAKIGKTGYDASAIAGSEFPGFPTLPSAATRTKLSPADFTKGGAVTAVALSASTNDRRRDYNAVHFGAEATATDGCALSRRPLVGPVAESLLLPLPAVNALLKLVQKTNATSLELVREPNSDRACFVAECESGAHWTLFVHLSDATVPDYAKINRQRDACTSAIRLTVRGEDLRDLWLPWKRVNYIVALFADGSLVAWGPSADEGIGTTLTAPTDAKPVVMLGAAVLDKLGKRLPDGLLTVEVTGDLVTIGGETFARYNNGPDLPGWVREELAHAFAADEAPRRGVVELVAPAEPVAVPETAAPDAAPAPEPVAPPVDSPATAPDEVAEVAPESGLRTATRWGQLKTCRAIVHLLESSLRDAHGGELRLTPEVLAEVQALLGAPSVVDAKRAA